MKKTISFVLAFLLVIGALPFSLIAENGASDFLEQPISARHAHGAGEGNRQINTDKIAIDADPEGGYEGDYVVIYNPSEDATASMSTGNMSGRINTAINPNMVDTRGEDALASDGMYRIDVDQYLAEEASKLMGDKPLPPDGDGTKATSYNVGDTANFKISYYSPFSTSTVQFKVVAKGDHCYVWTPTSSASNSYPLTQGDAQTAMQAFESKFDTMNNSFGNHKSGNGDGRVNILYYNITEVNPWTPGSNSGYVGGYFWSGDYSSDNNNLPIIHIDTYPSVYYNNNGVENSFSTLVHEYQHMIHYNYAPNSKAWINETMSAAAEEICYPGSSIFSRIMYYTGCEYSYNAFATPPKEYAAQHANLHYGYSMYDWSNELPDVLALYAQVSLFSQYLYTQAPQGNAVFKAILDELAKNSRNTFQTVCPTVLGMSASDFVRDFRIALTANTNRNVLDGKYGWELQQGYDPSEYYGIQNLYNLLGPIIFTDSSCLIKGGGAITVKPVGGVYNPPADANANLKYYGITLNTQSEVPPPVPTPTPTVEPSPAPFDPTEGELVANRTYYLEADGTYTAMISAYSTSSVYDLQTRFKDYLTSELCFGDNLGIFATSYDCTGIDANGDPVFSSQDNGYWNVVASYSRNGNYWYMYGFDFESHVCTGNSGKLFVFWLYGLLPSDSATGTFSACNDAISGVYVNEERVLPLPHCDLTIRERSFAYDFSTPLAAASTAEFFGDSRVSSILHIDTAFNEISGGNYCLELSDIDSAISCSAEAINLRGNIHVRFTPGSTNASADLRAIIRLSDGSYEWCRLSYFPASVVLCEEDFGNFTDGSVGDPPEPEYGADPVYNTNPDIGLWSDSGTAMNTPQFAGGVFGYDASFESSTGDSNGNAMVVTVDSNLYKAIRNGASGAAWPYAEFSFTGTGVDFLTHIGEDSGVFSFDLVPAGKPYSYAGDNSLHAIINTYYEGYLYQIPVLSYRALEYGNYNLRVTALYVSVFDLQKANAAEIVSSIPGIENVEYEYMTVCGGAGIPTRDRGTFVSYVDGIRVYNPIDTNANPKIADAYAALGELNPEFKNIRRMLASEPTAQPNTVLNLMLDGETGTAIPMDYNDISPYNEVYLRSNMSVAFMAANHSGLHLSLKSPDGTSFKVKINGEYLSNAAGNAVVIGHTAELYYDITDYVSENGMVSITCEGVGDTGTAVLSVVNLKLIGGADSSVQPVVTASSELVEFVEAIHFGVLGDADHDGTVSMSDALYVMRVSLGSLELGTYGTYCADMNRDGSIDMIDALAIMRMALRTN